LWTDKIPLKVIESLRRKNKKWKKIKKDVGTQNLKEISLKTKRGGRAQSDFWGSQRRSSKELTNRKTGEKTNSAP